METGTIVPVAPSANSTAQPAFGGSSSTMISHGFRPGGTVRSLTFLSVLLLGDNRNFVASDAARAASARLALAMRPTAIRSLAGKARGKGQLERLIKLPLALSAIAFFASGAHGPIDGKTTGSESRSILAAMMKSFSCSPLIFFVCITTVT
jgi:hypothetical protein